MTSSYSDSRKTAPNGYLPQTAQQAHDVKMTSDRRHVSAGGAKLPNMEDKHYIAVCSTMVKFSHKSQLYVLSLNEND